VGAPRVPRRARCWRGGVKVPDAREAHQNEDQEQQRDEDHSQGLLARRLHVKILADRRYKAEPSPSWTLHPS
jgi:hypothetical protein